MTELFKICAFDECNNIHSRRSKYCCDACRVSYKSKRHHARRRERMAVDEEFAESVRAGNRESYHRNKHKKTRRRKVKMAESPMYAEKIRERDREKAREKRKDPNYVEKQRQYHRNRYHNDEEFRQQCLERTRRSRAKKKQASNIINFLEAINQMGVNND